MTTVRLFVSLVLALVGALLGTALPTEAFAAPALPSISFTYDSQVLSGPLSNTATGRGPPVWSYIDCFAAAGDHASYGPSARSDGASRCADTNYDNRSKFAPTAHAPSTTDEPLWGTSGLLALPEPDGVAANAAVRLADSGVVNPATIRFSQSSISSSFRGGGSVKDLAAGLRNGTVNPADVPAIRLVERNGNYFTLDNRRLAAFQEAGIDIPVSDGDTAGDRQPGLEVHNDERRNVDHHSRRRLMSFEARAEQPMARGELAGFLIQLADSLVEEPEVWENDSLATFLRAWSAWLSDMDGYFVNRGEPVPEEPSWQLIAQMLLAARVYE